MINTEDQFVDWLKSLEIQTLTDELKQEIIDRVNDLIQDVFNEGYEQAKQNALEKINDL